MSQKSTVKDVVARTCQDGSIAYPLKFKKAWKALSKELKTNGLCIARIGEKKAAWAVLNIYTSISPTELTDYLSKKTVKKSATIPGIEFKTNDSASDLLLEAMAGNEKAREMIKKAIGL